MNRHSDFWTHLYNPPTQTLPRIGFSDYADSRVLKAVDESIEKRLFSPVLIKSADLSNDKRAELAEILQKNSKTPVPNALSLLDDSLVHGIALLISGKLDGLVAGATRPTSDVVRAALQFIGANPSQRLVAGHFLIESENRQTMDGTPFIFADCAVMPEPSSRALATVALGAADSYAFFTGKKPKVALLSFSTRDSAEHELVDRIKEAVGLIRKQAPELAVDGEIQVDAALDSAVAKIKNVGASNVAGQPNVFVFPTLEAGNIGYKLVQRFSECRVAGPILWGLKKPVSDLSRGCNVREVVDTALCISAMARKLN